MKIRKLRYYNVIQNFWLLHVLYKITQLKEIHESYATILRLSYILEP